MGRIGSRRAGRRIAADRNTAAERCIEAAGTAALRIEARSTVSSGSCTGGWVDGGWVERIGWRRGCSCRKAMGRRAAARWRRERARVKLRKRRGRSAEGSGYVNWRLLGTRRAVSSEAERKAKQRRGPSKLRAATSPKPTRWQHQYQTDHLHRAQRDCLPGVPVPACKAAVRLRQHLG